MSALPLNQPVAHLGPPLLLSASLITSLSREAAPGMEGLLSPGGQQLGAGSRLSPARACQASQPSGRKTVWEDGAKLGCSLKPPGAQADLAKVEEGAGSLEK